MKKKPGIGSKLLLFIAAAALVVVLFTPIWQIDLDAPQYPEGLSLQIHATGLKGNVDIINGLNHYIGMKTLHNEDFVEFKILPYAIIFFALLFVLTALLNSRRFLYITFALFVLFGVIAMVDFWKWEYDYGHNLNPDAAIQVPGMAYQPPLIGFKQLLNFGAYSAPNTGGWLFITAGVLLLICIVLEAGNTRRNRSVKTPAAAAVIALTFLFSSCNAGPDPIKAGSDSCAFCKMGISDIKYSGELLTNKGRAFKFDDIHCLLAFLKSDAVNKTDVKDIYISDYTAPHALINANEAHFLQGGEIHGPMNGNTIAFSNADSLKMVAAQLHAAEINREQLMK